MILSNHRTTALGLAALVASVLLLATGDPARAGAIRSRVPSSVPTVTTATSSEGNAAMNRPHYWAWKRFIDVNRTHPITGGALWETWASDSETFPTCPAADAPPAWPAKANREKVLRSRSQILSTEGDGTLSWYTLEDGVPMATTIDFPEEVRRNRPSFDYIVANGFYYTEGLAAAFEEAQEAIAAIGGSPSQSLAAAQRVVTFPVDAIEIKADWVPVEYIPAQDRSSYYTTYAVSEDEDGNTSDREEYALVAMHISTKDIPAWFWATWVNEKVLGRCDYTGCVDRFGMTPHYTAPNEEANYPYPTGPLNPELLAMIRGAGLDSSFENYRLVGAQTNFVDTTGQPILLSNTITEQGNLQTGSCMTCHSRAAFDSTGAPISVVDSTTSSETALTGDTGVTDNGIPDSSWFWTSENGVDQDGDTVTYFSSSTEDTGVDAIQFDFVWGILFASSADACD